jgi:hypothetical protein
MRQILCDNCKKECTHNSITIRDNSPLHCCHIESCDYEVCSFQCGIVLLEKQINAYSS